MEIARGIGIALLVFLVPPLVVFGLTAVVAWLMGPLIWVLGPLLLIPFVASFAQQFCIRLVNLFTLAHGSSEGQDEPGRFLGAGALGMVAAVEVTGLAALLVLGSWAVWAAAVPTIAHRPWLLIPLAAYLGWFGYNAYKLVRRIRRPPSARR